MEKESRLADVKSRIAYQTDESIILDTYLDVLMNVKSVPVRSGPAQDELIEETADKQSTADPTAEVWSKLTKYKQYNYLKSNPRELPRGERDLKYWGGIMLPVKQADGVSNPGSGNIVIIGEPGVGKSTLAFQMAVSCTSDVNNGIAVYYSLSTPRTQLIDCMCRDKSHEDIFNKCSVISAESDINDDDSELLKHLEKLLRRGEDGRKIGTQVLFPSLSPKGLSGDSSDNAQHFFRQRFREIEMMLRTVRKYNDRHANEKENYPPIKMVVLDSLNDFGIEPLNKVEVSKLFELFEHYGILGVFTLAENRRNTREELIIEDAVRYDADTVLHLMRVPYKNYMCTLLEVAKSRYVKAVIGEHVYKIRDKTKDNETYKRIAKFVEVYPSLHHVIIGSSPDELYDHGLGSSAVNGPGNDNVFGIKALENILPESMSRHQDGLAQIVTLKGDSGLFKSDLAVNALLYGMTRKRNGLVIHLSERNLMKNGNVRLESSVYRELLAVQAGADYPVFVPNTDHEAYIGSNPDKRDINCWQWNDCKLFEMVFRSGALMPEEFMEDVLTVIRRERIRAIAFTDIKDIGASYPFLVDNRTSGDLFLSAFIHIMRNEGVDLIATSSNTGFEASDKEMRKIGIMSDAVLEFKLMTGKKPGEPIVTLVGEGSIIHDTKAGVYVMEAEKAKLETVRETADGLLKGSIVLKPEGTHRFVITDPKQKE